MWTVVYIASDPLLAGRYKALLEAEGILAMLRPLGVPQADPSGPAEVLVAASEAREAAEILASSFTR